MVGKSEGQGPLARSRRRWENIKADLKETVFKGVVMVYLA